MFLYYIPGRTQGPEIPERMMQCQFDGRDPVVRSVLKGGPDGGQGAIVCDKAVGSSAGYFPDRQTWTQINEHLWVGYENEAPPTPEGLARDKQLNGHYVTLAKQRWMIPAARRWEFETGAPLSYDVLPRKMTYSNGKWQFADIEDKCRRLWDVAEKWFPQWLSGGDELTILEAAEMAVDALSMNYRVWHEEVSILGMLDMQGVRAVLDAVIDEPTLNEWFQKKSEASGG